MKLMTDRGAIDVRETIQYTINNDGFIFRYDTEVRGVRLYDLIPIGCDARADDSTHWVDQQRDARKHAASVLSAAIAAMNADCSESKAPPWPAGFSNPKWALK